MRLFIAFFLVLGLNTAGALADHDTATPSDRQRRAAGAPACNSKAFFGKRFTAEGGETLVFRENGTLLYTNKDGATAEYTYEAFRAKGNCQISLYLGKKEVQSMSAPLSDLSTITHGTYLFSLVNNDA